MTAAFTVILPHKRNPGNDRALAICLDCLYTNTRSDFILISDAAYDQPLYPRINRMVEQAATDIVVYLCSDMFVTLGWDMPMLSAWNPDVFVVGVVVEPGVMGAHPNNAVKDFGRRPETFRRAEFEAWAASEPMADNEGWVAPVMYPRVGFLEMGGLPSDLPQDEYGFSGGDTALFAKWKATGHAICRVPSFTYHLQRYSDLGEQSKTVRMQS